MDRNEVERQYEEAYGNADEWEEAAMAADRLFLQKKEDEEEKVEKSIPKNGSRRWCFTVHDYVREDEWSDEFGQFCPTGRPVKKRGKKRKRLGVFFIFFLKKIGSFFPCSE